MAPFSPPDICPPQIISENSPPADERAHGRLLRRARSEERLQPLAVNLPENTSSPLPYKPGALVHNGNL